MVHRAPRSRWQGGLGTACLFLLATSCGDGGEAGGFAPFSGTWATLNFPNTGPNPTQMSVVPAFPNLLFDRPTFLVHPPDGTDRLFVLEQRGLIRVFPNSAAVTTAPVFMDITDRVNQSHDNEEGLLGLAFAPDYVNNGYFYVHYSAASPRRSVISRFSVDPQNPDLGDRTTELILLEVNQPFGNHNGGMLAFGPDDMLYLTLGDGGSGGDPQGNGQNLTTLLGSMLRIDPHGQTGPLNYGIPADNPFVGAGGGVREEIWAYGLRHPWRFSFDRQTGQCWLGDVGQGAREEIDLIFSGENYGWNVFEGNLSYNNPGQLPPSQFHAPIVDYDRLDARSVIGGYVYRGSRLPELRGAYIHGDYATGRIWALVESGGLLASNTEIGFLSAISSFGEDQAGEVFAVSHGNGTISTFDRPQGQGPTFPARLSETGIFANTASLTPARGVLEYSVGSELWSDGATKRRFVVLPQGGRIAFDAADPWSLPQGTVLIKHFELELATGDPASVRRLETRVLIHEVGGWAGYTYRWDAAQTDADLLSGRATDTFTIADPAAPGGTCQQTWTYPSATDCLQCHTAPMNYALGPRTHQLNHDVTIGGNVLNQLGYWDSIGAFAGGIGDPAQYDSYPDPRASAGAIGERARSYLAANCSMCHVPGGSAPDDIDMRYTTPDAQTNLFDVVATRGDLGLTNAHRVLRGVKESSVLWERMRRTDGTRMPPIGTVLVDGAVVQLIGEWIDGL